MVLNQESLYIIPLRTMVGEKAGLKSIIMRRGEVSGTEMEGRNARTDGQKRIGH